MGYAGGKPLFSSPPPDFRGRGTAEGGGGASWGVLPVPPQPPVVIRQRLVQLAPPRRHLLAGHRRLPALGPELRLDLGPQLLLDRRAQRLLVGRPAHRAAI